MDRYHEVLRMEQIVTESGGTRILDNAKLNLFRGEVAGLIGINYAGKTTLAGGFTGHFPYTSGRTLLEDKPVSITSIEQARGLGIFYIQPRSSLVGALSVAENILLTPERGRGFVLRNRRDNERAQELLDSIGLSIQADSSVGALSFFQRVLVETAKALWGNARIIVYDNVVSALSPSALKRFQLLTATLCGKGIAVLLVEARVQLLTSLCDRIFVVRNGRTVGVQKRQEYDGDKIVSLMIGHGVGDAGPLSEPAHSGEETLLELQGIDCAQVLHGFHLPVYRGEILGILSVDKQAGAVIEALLSGTLEPARGSLLLDGKPVRLKGPHDAVDKGIVIVPEDDGMIPDLNLAENILLTAMRVTGRRGGLLNRSELRYLEDELLSEYCRMGSNRVCADDPLPEGWLIRKKIAFCRGLAASPRLMVLTNPTQRIDFYSRQEIYEDILSLKKQRITAIVISSNIDELVSFCDRIAVVQGGAVTNSLAVAEDQKERIRMQYGSFLKGI